MDKIFVNGFTSWMETHHEIVSAITFSLEFPEQYVWPLVQNRLSEQGTGGLYELAEELTDEFEKRHEGHEWDGDWIDAIDDFIKEKLDN